MFHSEKNGLDMGSTIFDRIVKHEIKFHPNKMHLRHELFSNDLPRLRNFCNWFLQKPIGFDNKLMIGDEAEFHLNGRVNNNNVRDTMLLLIRVLNLILMLEFPEKKSQFG